MILEFIRTECHVNSTWCFFAGRLLNITKISSHLADWRATLTSVLSLNMVTSGKGDSLILSLNALLGVFVTKLYEKLVTCSVEFSIE